MRLSKILMLQIVLKVSAKNCNKLNHKCCYNEYFDNNTNRCDVCINGSFGWNCETPCKKGFYGYICSTPCECEAHLCDKETGCPRNIELTTIRTNSSTFTTLSPIVSEGKTSQEDIATTQARKQPTFKRNNVEENVTEDVFNETSFQKSNISGTAAPSDNSSERRLQDSMLNLILFFIGSITTVFIGGTFICFGKRFMDIFINRYQGRTQPLTRTPPIDRDSGYDEIRYSQLLRNSNICAEVGASSSANEMTGYSSKSHYLLSVIYDNYDDDNEDYSRLLLRQNQSTCIPKRKNLLEDEGYAFLRKSDINELKSDILIQKHRSLPTFATIHNQISSTDFKPLSRCLSENNILRSIRFSPSSFETN